MSAFIVEDQTVNRLVTFLNTDRTGSCGYSFERIGYCMSQFDDLKRLASDLFQMNCDAVGARYGKGTAAGDTAEMPGEFPFRIAPCGAIVAYKAAKCLLYQCSEGDVPERPLFKAMEAAIAAIADAVIRTMPEYNQARWE